jgi:hypothetical protein
MWLTTLLNRDACLEIFDLRIFKIKQGIFMKSSNFELEA